MKLSELLLFLVAFFDKREQLIEHYGQYTQNDNAEHDVIQPENLTAVDNEIAKAGVGHQKFADNDADEAETYIDFQITDDGRDAGRKNNIAKNISACAAKCPDEQ